MRLDIAKKSRFGLIAKENDMPFSAVLRAYIVESFLKQLSFSSYSNVLLLTNPEQIGRSAYCSAKEGKLFFYYTESERKIADSRLIAGQKLSKDLGRVMKNELFPKDNREEIDWWCTRSEYQEGVLRFSMLAVYDKMQIPLELEIRRFDQSSCTSTQMRIECLAQEQGLITVRTFPAEKILIQNLIEILDKLELIADMQPYMAVDRILQTQSISGRRVIEAFEEKARAQASFQKMLRLEQLKSYRTYAYMKKRWNSYRSNSAEDPDEWEEVLLRILRFLEPIWTAFCENIVFLDDWMPELGRFLV